MPGKETPAGEYVTGCTMCGFRWAHRITVPFTHGICLGCWLDWHFGAVYAKETARRP